MTSHSDENFLDWAITGTNLYYFLSAGVPIIKWFFVIFWEIFCKNYHQNSQEEQMLLFGIMTFSYWLVYILKAVHWTINALSIKFSTIVYLLLDCVFLIQKILKRIKWRIGRSRCTNKKGYVMHVTCSCQLHEFKNTFTDANILKTERKHLIYLIFTYMYKVQCIVGHVDICNSRYSLLSTRY